MTHPRSSGRVVGADGFVEAAGGVIVNGDQVLTVHRPQRDDWSLPKGHVEDGETLADAATREVAEETGLRCRILSVLGTTEYTNRFGQPKRVTYFLMQIVGGHFVENDEVDEVRWMGFADLDRLSYAIDADLLRRDWSNILRPSSS